MSPLMAGFFDSLRDGIVIVDPEGVVRYANRTGFRLLQPRLGQLLPIPGLQRLVKDLVAGMVSTGAKTELPAPDGGTPRTVTIHSLPIPNTLALVMSEDDEKSFYAMTLENLYEFISIDLVDPLKRASDKMSRLTRQVSDRVTEDEGAELGRVARDTEIVASQLGRIKLLAELFRSAPMVAQDRLPFSDMIHDALDAEGSLIISRGIDLYINGFDSELPPVYGSRSWLTHAFRELLQNAVRYSPSGSKVEIALRCTGTHVIISFRNHGQFESTHLKRDFLYVPFNRVAQYLKGNRMPAKAILGRETAGGQRAGGVGLGLPICQQVVALHGGSLNIVEGGEDRMTEFNVELATGAPARDDQRLEVAQAQRYAHDMAELMARMRQRKGTPSSARAGGSSPSRVE